MEVRWPSNGISIFPYLVVHVLYDLVASQDMENFISMSNH